MDYDRLRELQAKFEENPRRYFAPLANEYRKAGNAKRAIEICRAHLAQMPGHMSGQIVFGQSLFEGGEYEEARKVFAGALALDPENLIALRSLGDMSLQAGDLREARSWYTRLLDADPKDTDVIALVSEIDSAGDAGVPVPEVIPGIDTDTGDQQIPQFDAPPPDAQSVQAAAWPPEQAPQSDNAPPPMPSEMAEARRDVPPPMPSEMASRDVPPPMPSEEAEARAAATASADAAEETGSPYSAPAAEAEPAGLERHYPTEAPSEESSGATEGLVFIPTGEDTETASAEGLELPPNPADTEAAPAEGLELPPSPEDTEIAAAEGLEAVNLIPGSREDDADALDSWAPPAEAEVNERADAAEEIRAAASAPEPFVNETMAQLYLQQGYRQLALKVYRQLLESRPADEALKARIAEIEALDEAEMGGAPPEARREEHEPERPREEPASPRSPSIETPTPGRRESEEAPAYQPPAESPPWLYPTPGESESVESPGPEGPRAEPEGVSAHVARREEIAPRQPSIKEFFATLGRRRPPRTETARMDSPESEPLFATNNAAHTGTIDSPGHAAIAPALATPTPPASLDTVFAGAQVSPADSRAASRLAGAFSGARPSTTPKTPAVPTPRVNPRLQTQESEEDVAKFRAWLDGLTGE